MQEGALEARIKAEGLVSLVGELQQDAKRMAARSKKPDVETKFEGTTLVVRIPMRLQRRGGRKRIFAPGRSAIVHRLKPHPAVP